MTLDPAGPSMDPEGFSITIQLTPELNKFIAGKLSTGRYASAEEVVLEALSLQNQHEVDTAELDRELGEGIASLDRGEYVTPEEVWRELADMSRQRRKAASA